MREPKYRAYDKETKKIYPVLSLSLDFKLCDLYAGPEEGLAREWKDVELLEFTGLHDKNGREIYEGDVVNDGGVIVFGGGRYFIKYEGEKWEDLTGKEDEVLGNVWENPELLKATSNPDA